jgi:hypothetical protein
LKRRRNAIDRLKDSAATIAPAARLTQNERSPAARIASAFVNWLPTCSWKIDRHHWRLAGPLNGNVTPP